MYIFSGRVTLRVVHTSAYSCDTAAATPKISLRVQLIFFLTFPYYSKIRKIVRKYILYYVYCYMVYTRLRVILVAALCYVPFFLYAVPFGVIHRSLVGTAYQRTTNCESCQCKGQYRIVHILSLIHI